MECYKQLYIDNFVTLDETAISQKPQIAKIQPRWKTTWISQELLKKLDLYFKISPSKKTAYPNGVTSKFYPNI